MRMSTKPQIKSLTKLLTDLNIFRPDERNWRMRMARVIRPTVPNPPFGFTPPKNRDKDI